MRKEGMKNMKLTHRARETVESIVGHRPDIFMQMDRGTGKGWLGNRMNVRKRNK